MKLKDKVSPIYKNVMNYSFANIEVPKEVFANCFDCHLCVHDKSLRAQTKCCDYQPIIPNYMVGAILSDNSEDLREGKARIKNKILDKLGVTPYGIIPSMSYQLLFTKTRIKNIIPNKADIIDLLCPYNKKGMCTIWKYRNELCASFHCHSVSGKTGIKFWNLFYQYLQKTETSISIYVLKELNYPIDKLNLQRIDALKLKLENEQEKLNNNKYKRIWDRWIGSEESFYIECYEVFKTINQMKYVEIIGQEGKLIEEKMHHLNQEYLKKIIPKYLKLNESYNKIVHLNDGSIQINKITLNAIKYKFIKLFDGSTDSHEIVRKSIIMNSSISLELPYLIKEGLLIPFQN